MLLGAASTAVPAGSSAPDLLDEARARGSVRRVVRLAEPQYHGLRERWAVSDLAVRGRVIDESIALSPDGQTLWTDYTIEVLEVFAHTGTSAPPTIVQARAEGGNLVVEGRPLSVVNELFPRLPWVREHILFLVRSPGEATLYRFLGGAQGVFRHDHHDRMRCHLPKSAWGFLCRSRDGGGWAQLLNELRSYK